MWTWYDAEIIKIINETEKVKRFWLKIKSPEVFDFKPGQFVTLDLPIHEKRLKRWRSYSIASVPNKENIIELCIVLLENGLGTQYLFNEVEIGSILKFKGAAGVFHLPENIDEDLLFICTGTGVAPFRSMIQTLLNNEFNKSINLVFGTRYAADILYLDEWKSLALKFPNFNLHLALSREEYITKLPYNNIFSIQKGYVHSIYEKIIEQKGIQKTLLCGWNVMLDEAKPRLLNMGLEEKNIIIESYG